MKNRRTLFRTAFLIASGTGLISWLHAQQSSPFLAITPLANREIALNLDAPAGVSYRIDATTNFKEWNGLVTLPTSSVPSQQYTDSAARFHPARYYRATAVEDSGVLSGDHLATANGDAVLHPVNHATVVMSWNGLMIYCDPVNGSAPYRGFSKADLILVTHSHSDHLSTSSIESVRGPNCRIIGPQAVFNALTASQRGSAIVLGYGDSTNILGLTVEAVYAYNSNHSPLGFGNGYVLTLGGKRIYLSGDTGDAPEIHALKNIDVAFLCMNTPYTMTPNQAATAVLAFRPGVVYPYHYRNQSGSTTNAAWFKQLIGSEPDIEVRLRKWY